MYFLFYAWVSDGIMKFENVKFENLVFLRRNRTFQVKQGKPLTVSLCGWTAWNITQVT